jgi:hypothetical protein
MITLLPEYSKDRVASLDVTSVSYPAHPGESTSWAVVDVKLDGFGPIGSLMMLYLYLTVSSGPILQYKFCPLW